MIIKNKIITGILIGCLAGIIDVVPMLLQGLTWDANLSAFSLWVVSGFLIATSSLRINPIIKGILVSFLVLIPSAFLIAWNNPFNLVPIAVMTLLLGGMAGFVISKITFAP